MLQINCYAKKRTKAEGLVNVNYAILSVSNMFFSESAVGWTNGGVQSNYQNVSLDQVNTSLWTGLYTYCINCIKAVLAVL